MAGWLGYSASALAILREMALTDPKFAEKMTKVGLKAERQAPEVETQAKNT